jgi:hypothetical protein
VCDPGQFRILLIERGFYAVFSSWDFALSLQQLPVCGFGLQQLLLFVSCLGLPVG